MGSKILSPIMYIHPEVMEISDLYNEKQFHLAKKSISSFINMGFVINEFQRV